MLRDKGFNPSIFIFVRHAGLASGRISLLCEADETWPVSRTLGFVYPLASRHIYCFYSFCAGADASVNGSAESLSDLHPGGAGWKEDTLNTSGLHAALKIAL